MLMPLPAPTNSMMTNSSNIADMMPKVVNSDIAISRRTLPLASEKLRPTDSNTPLPSTRIARGTYTNRPTIREKSQSDNDIATRVPTTPKTPESQGGATSDKAPAAKSVTSPIIWPPEAATKRAAKIQNRMIREAPTSPQ